MTRALSMAALLLAPLALGGCDRPEDQETGSITDREVREAREALDPALVAALDSGNAAYRAEQYERSLRFYRQATELDEDVAAGWFGVYMAELALGNTDAASDAMERARALAPRSTLIHPEQAEPEGGTEP